MGSTTEIPGKLWNVVLGKNWEDQLDRSCEKWRSITYSHGRGGGRNFLRTIKRRNVNWIGHVLRRNCLLKHVIEEKIEGRIEVTRRPGRRRKQLLDDLNETERYWGWKEDFGCQQCWVELVRNLVAHGDAREGKWMGNRRMEWVASTIPLYLGTWSVQHYYQYYYWSALLDCQ